VRLFKVRRAGGGRTPARARRPPRGHPLTPAATAPAHPPRRAHAPCPPSPRGAASASSPPQIQRWFLHLHATPGARAALSLNEGLFLDAYENMRGSHVGAAVLGRLRERDQTLGAVDGDEGGPEARLRDGPPTSRHVLVRARAAFRVATEPVLVVRRQGDDEPDAVETMRVGALQILPYAAVREFILDGSMEAQ
jgi:hypothetical protein